jgi:four helix bundle protein
MFNVECSMFNELPHNSELGLAQFWFGKAARWGNAVFMPHPKYDLEDRLIRFGTNVCRLSERLPSTPLGRHIGIQMLRSSTSPFANYGEVKTAESRRDFIHKLGICLKELRETYAWLKFIDAMNLCSNQLLRDAMREGDQLLAIIATSIRTARRNEEPRNRMSNVH